MKFMVLGGELHDFNEPPEREPCACDAYCEHRGGAECRKLPECPDHHYRGMGYCPFCKASLSSGDSR